MSQCNLNKVTAQIIRFRSERALVHGGDLKGIG
jgi:hypothetical protein